MASWFSALGFSDSSTSEGDTMAVSTAATANGSASPASAVKNAAANTTNGNAKAKAAVAGPEPSAKKASPSGADAEPAFEPAGNAVKRAASSGPSSKSPTSGAAKPTTANGIATRGPSKAPASTSTPGTSSAEKETKAAASADGGSGSGSAAAGGKGRMGGAKSEEKEGSAAASQGVGGGPKAGQKAADSLSREAAAKQKQSKDAARNSNHSASIEKGEEVKKASEEKERRPQGSSATSAAPSPAAGSLDTLDKKLAAATAAAAAAGSEVSRRHSSPSATDTSAASVAKAGALRRIRVTEALPELVSQAQACVYEPAEYFVAWQGVLTIIYSGIPPSLVRLKTKLSEQFPGLPPENPGSLWPKTSLACLKDDKRLSPDQLQQLRDICSKMNFQLVYSPAIHVSSVTVVVYENCCLEKQLVATHIQLQQPEDLTPVSEEQRAHVRKVADEFSAKNLDSYWYHVSKDGNRSKHYRQGKAGATLVHFLGDEVPPSVTTFQKLVEAAMPGMYDWFPAETLHITLRALC